MKLTLSQQKNLVTNAILTQSIKRQQFTGDITNPQDIQVITMLDANIEAFRAVSISPQGMSIL